MKKNLRYLILLLILLFVATNQALLRYRTTSWEMPLMVSIYSVSGDNSVVTDKYIDALNTRNFKVIETFVNREARRYGVSIDAIEIRYGGRLASHPPQPPSGKSIAENIWWSLRFRAWAWRQTRGSESSDSDVDLFVSYNDPTITQTLRHSVGLRGGMIGIINAFADKTYQGSNQVVITHELMHTLGARDKYDENNLPLYPSGYAEPYRQPLYPQRDAEIMGGRIPISGQRANIPKSLRQVIVGPFTAEEINWPVGD